MFGYISVNKPELKVRDFDVYHAYYCGVCRDLRADFGVTGQMTLSYDLTFLGILLTALYEPDETQETTRCLIHPLTKHPMMQPVKQRSTVTILSIVSVFSALPILPAFASG